MPGVPRGSLVGCVWAGLWIACLGNMKGNRFRLGCPVYLGEAWWAVCGLVCGLGGRRGIGLRQGGWCPTGSKAQGLRVLDLGMCIV